jgi:hypothetical protein
MKLGFTHDIFSVWLPLHCLLLDSNHHLRYLPISSKSEREGEREKERHTIQVAVCLKSDVYINNL